MSDLDTSLPWLDALKWDADGLIPAISQDATSGRVLIVAWMNRAALQETVASGKAVYWSRSRQRLWRKGEESGHEQKVAHLCAQYLKQFSFEKIWIDAAGNTVATNYAHNKGDSPDLLLFGHMDTIAEPLPYKRVDGRIYGRGAVDAKSPLAALLSAGAKSLSRSRVRVKRWGWKATTNRRPKRRAAPRVAAISVGWWP